MIADKQHSIILRRSFLMLFAVVLVLLNSELFSQQTSRTRRTNNPPKFEKNAHKAPRLVHEKNNEDSDNIINAEGDVMQRVLINGDTLWVYELNEVLIIAPREFRSRYQQMRYNRLVRNVKRVYPYAKLAGQKYQEYNEMLLNEPNERKRNTLMKQAEDELRASFEEELRRLTISQGLILVKLIDRETQNTTYEVLREFRGVFSAVFWQGIGRFFGYNLKTKYDAHGEDKMIEEIIMLIEVGVF